MSIQDVIKKSFLKGFQNTNLTMRDVAILMAVAAVLGIYIFFIYRIMTASTFYSKSFNVSLILMCVITAAIIVAIQSSVIVSLGMVGALSIVRFRTAVKDPLDLIFMFWSIGIICGAGMVGLALILTVLATVLVLVFYRLPDVRKSMILVINAEDNSHAAEIFEIVKKYDKSSNVKSRTVTGESAEFLIEVRVRDGEGLLNDLNQMTGVLSVSLIAHKGDTAF